MPPDETAAPECETVSFTVTNARPVARQGRVTTHRCARTAGRGYATVGAKTTELPMRYRDPIPEIPPVPLRRSRADAPGTQPATNQSSQPPQREQPALPDLLEAFWGEAAEARVAEGDAERSVSPRKRSQRRNAAAARSTQRSKTASDV